MTENIEGGLYSAMRGIEESIMLLNHPGEGTTVYIRVPAQILKKKSLGN